MRTDVIPPGELLKSLGVTAPADIDLEAIAWTQGVRVRYRALDGCDARIVGCGDQAIVTVNERSPSRRRRFSIAHELGHWQHHRGQRLVCRGDETAGKARRPPMERTADEYAAALLMPEYLVTDVIGSKSKRSLDTIRGLSDAFDVSFTAAAIRSVSALKSVVLVCHGARGLKWFLRSPDVPDRWYLKTELDPSTAAIEVLYRPTGQRPPRRTPAAAWFSSRESSGFYLQEESVHIAGDVISMLVLTDPQMLA